MEEKNTWVGGKLVTKFVENCDETEDVDGLSGNPAANTTPTAESASPGECDQIWDFLEIPDEVDYQCGVVVNPIVEGDGEQSLPGAVYAAVHRMKIPTPELVIQPPDGLTLVNFDTNFYTEAGPIDQTVRLLGRRVQLRVTPVSFRWHFGDGTSTTTSTPGAPYPDLEVTHNYTQKGSYRPHLETTWVAQFRVGGGAWRSVPGSVVVADDPQSLEAITARPVLVAPDGG